MCKGQSPAYFRVRYCLEFPLDELRIFISTYRKADPLQIFEPHTSEWNSYAFNISTIFRYKWCNLEKIKWY
jgi:hypothetical protein